MKLRQDFLVYILISLLITIIFSKEELFIRYFFISLPTLPYNVTENFIGDARSLFKIFFGKRPSDS